jgi:hypothetical protein
MNNKAFLIIWLDKNGNVYDAQIASEFPVTQFVNQNLQACLHESHGPDLEEAERILIAWARERAPWVFTFKSLNRQMCQRIEWRNQGQARARVIDEVRVEPGEAFLHPLYRRVLFVRHMEDGFMHFYRPNHGPIYLHNEELQKMRKVH